MKYEDIKKGQKFYLLTKPGLNDAIGVIVAVTVVSKNRGTYSRNKVCLEQAIDGALWRFYIYSFEIETLLIPWDTRCLSNAIHDDKQEKKRQEFRDKKEFSDLDIKPQVLAMYNTLNKKQKKKLTDKIKNHRAGIIKTDGSFKVSKINADTWLNIREGIFCVKFPYSRGEWLKNWR